MPSVHYPFGGSTIVRTLACPAWRSEADKAPKLPRTSTDANRGSALHEAAEWCLLEERVPAELLGKHYAEFDYTLDTDDITQLEIALDAAYAVFDKCGVTEFITEQLMEYAEDVGGSADVIAVGHKRGRNYRLIVDWKFGHQPVRAIKQGAFYDLCGSKTPELADFYDTDRQVVVVTIQPQVSDDADCYEFEADELQQLQAEMLYAIEQARLGDLPPVAGPHCQYCPAAPYCPAKRAEAARFLTLDPKHRQQLAEGMQMVEAMKAHIKAIEAEVFDALKNDEQVPGWKLVQKRATRKWKDEEMAEHGLRAAGLHGDLHISKLLSPAQVETLLKKEKIDLDVLSSLVNTESSGVTIAPESDKRPAVPGQNQMPEALDALMKTAS